MLTIARIVLFLAKALLALVTLTPVARAFFDMYIDEWLLSWPIYGAATFVTGWWASTIYITRKYRRSTNPDGITDYNLAAYLTSGSSVYSGWGRFLWKGVRELTLQEAEQALTNRGFPKPPAADENPESSSSRGSKINDAYLCVVAALLRTLGHNKAKRLSPSVATLLMTEFDADNCASLRKEGSDSSELLQEQPSDGPQEQGMAVAKRKVVASMLEELGYRPGPLEAEFTQELSRALKTYQRDRGLPRTGRIDPETWNQILSSETLARPKGD